MIPLAIFGAITLFLLGALVVVLTSGDPRAKARLVEVTAPQGPVGGVEPPGMLSESAGLLAPLRKLFGGSDQDLISRLATAGYKKPYHADLFYGARVLGPIAGVLLATFAPKDNIIPAILVLGSLGFFLPDLWLGQATKRRRTELRHGLPDAVDLLVICMEAGLGLDQALIRVSQELKYSHPALAEELLTVQREQRAGKARIEAWRALADRTRLELVDQFVGMLAQTDRFGTPVAKSLGQFSDAIRVRRIQAAEELAAKTTVKLIFPLVLFIFPSVFVVLLGPAVMNIIRSLSQSLD